MPIVIFVYQKATHEKITPKVLMAFRIDAFGGESQIQLRTSNLPPKSAS